MKNMTETTHYLLVDLGVMQGPFGMLREERDC